jgi:hypothetical protein
VRQALGAGGPAVLVVDTVAIGTEVRWLMRLPHPGWGLADRMGMISSAMCALGVSVYFWAVILAPLAKNRYWSAKQCQLMSLLTLIPGAIFLVFTSSFLRGVDRLVMWRNYRAACVFGQIDDDRMSRRKI